MTFLSLSFIFIIVATQSRSSTPPTTPLSLEGEPEEVGTTQHSEDSNYSAEGASLLPIVNLADDFDESTSNSYANNRGRVLPSLSRITPNIQSLLRRANPPSYRHIQNMLQENSQPLRRNPTRLARPTSSLGPLQRRRRSKSPSQEAVVDQLHSTASSVNNEDLQQASRPITMNMEAT